MYKRGFSHDFCHFTYCSLLSLYLCRDYYTVLSSEPYRLGAMKDSNQQLRSSRYI